MGKKVKGKESKSKVKAQGQVPSNKKPRNESRQRPKQVKISDAEQKKYFPNLSKKIVVNFSGNDSDSESEHEDNINDPHSDNSKSNPVTNSLFGLDLEAFLKQARNSSDSIKPNIQILKNNANQIKVSKKIALTPQLKAKASELTLADKKKLISAKISHLSKSKQLEFQRLKEILARKQLEKKLKNQKKNEIPKLPPGHPTAPKKSHSITEEEEEALRNNLIQNMIKSKNNDTVNETRGEKSKKEIEQRASSEYENSLPSWKNNISKPKMSIELSGDSREVKLNDDKENEDSEKAAELKQLESDVVEMRKGLAASLFKLSAYMS